MGKLLPPILALVGLLAGVGAGVTLRPEPEPDPDAVAVPVPPASQPAGEFVRLNNQFVVPVLAEARVRSLVVMSLSIEVPPGTSTEVFALEPKLRDAFLQVLFDHANAGGFSGAFTAASTMNTLRAALREAARGVLGAAARDVLITEVVRQDS